MGIDANLVAMNLMQRVREPLMRLLDEEPRAVFLGSNFDVSALDGGSTRIVAATGHGLVVVRTGLLRRLTPYAVESRRRLEELRNPLFLWPGTTLLGEMYAEPLSGIWVHRRYRDEVVAAYAIAVQLTHH